MEPASQNLPTANGNYEADTTVVQLHSHHFENPQELSSVLKTFWEDDKFSVEMQNDMYIIRVSGPPAENQNTKMEDVNDIAGSLIDMAKRKNLGKEIGADKEGG